MLEERYMRKVIVLGCPGSGKTIFSGKLEEYTRLPLFHLDNMWWKHVVETGQDPRFKKRI